MNPPQKISQDCHWGRRFFAGVMYTHRFLPLALTGALLLFGGCATAPSNESTEAAPAPGDRGPGTESRRESAREPVTATETAVTERRTSAGGGSGTSADMAKLVDQLNEAARELATLRTANAKLRAERERTRPVPAAEPVVKADPSEERLAASLKSYTQFKQEMTSLITEMEKLKKASAEMSADTKAAAEQARQARAAMARVEEDARVEKRLRLEAEANAGQLREQLQTIARAMTNAGLSADKLSAQAESGGARSRSGARLPAKYVVREGDTLMKISERMYGDSDKWRVIMDANRGRVGTDGALEVGTELQIPRN